MINFLIITFSLPCVWSAISSVPPKTNLENVSLQQLPMSSLRLSLKSQQPPTSASNEYANKSFSTSRPSSRKPKFFPYFLIQFPNERCTGMDGSTGLCVSSKQCRMLGGTTVSSCARGFGACCKYVTTCGQESSKNDISVRTTFSEIRAGNASAPCRLMVPKMQSTCQVRLDFVEFEFGHGLTNGECSEGRVKISNAVNFGKDGMTLCGNLTGQHLYLHYGMSSKIYIDMGEASLKDKLSIRLSHIRCDSPRLVPRYCTQHYTEKEGQIRSLNWPVQQLNNQDYTVCVDDSYEGFAANTAHYSPLGIQWSSCGGNNSFFITGNASNESSASADCRTDYVQVFGGNRQCTYPFMNQTVTATPYLLRVKFDETETARVNPDENNKIIVSVPVEGCQSLNTDETKCSDVIKPVHNKEIFKKEINLCVCVHAIKSHEVQQIDQGNTGFCLQYKLLNK